MEINSRFTQASSVAARTLCLLPANLEQLKDKESHDISEFYRKDLPSPDTFNQELKEVRLWKTERNLSEDKPNTIQKIPTIYRIACSERCHPSTSTSSSATESEPRPVAELRKRSMGIQISKLQRTSKRMTNLVIWTLITIV